MFRTLKTKAREFLSQYEKSDPATFAAAQQAIGGLLILDGAIGIDNPFAGKKRPGILGTLVGMAIGIVFMLIPSFAGNISGANSMTATTDAVVVSTTSAARRDTDSGGSCSLTARYTVNDRVYTQKSSMSTSEYCTLTPGQTIPINYNPQNPGAFAYKLQTLNLVMSVFFWAGLIALISSIITFFIRLLSIFFGWKLLRNGRALASTLPEGTNLGTVIDEIKQNFKSNIFSGGAAPGQGLALPGLLQAQAPPQTVTQPQAPVAAPPPVQPPVQAVPQPPAQPLPYVPPAQPVAQAAPPPPPAPYPTPHNPQAPTPPPPVTDAVNQNNERL